MATTGAEYLAMLVCSIVIAMNILAVYSYMELKRKQWKGAWWAGATFGTIIGFLPVLTIIVACVYGAVRPLWVRPRVMPVRMI